MALRYVVYAIILLMSPAVSPTAKANASPNYGTATVTVPFVNSAAIAPPTYASPEIKIGFANPPGAATNPATAAHPTFAVTMDTGSVGIVVGSHYFNAPADGTADPTYIGGTETLTSSGIIDTGSWYTTTVNLYNGNAVVASSTVPVLAVTSIACVPGARECNPNAPTADINYFGIGFGGGDGLPQGTPDKNAFLNVTTIGGSAVLPSPGYILSTAGVQIGLTSSNAQGFALIKLEPLLSPSSDQWQKPQSAQQNSPSNTNVLTDWQHARATITVNGVSASGSILFDTGVATGFLTPPIGVKVNTGQGPPTAECSTTTPTCAVTGTKVQVSFPVASFSYTVGPGNGSQSGNPVSPLALSVEQNGVPFLNTTVHFLQAFYYMYDAANGFIGLKTTGTTPAQYAAYTPSGLSLGGVFQCFFSWAQGYFRSNGSQYATAYSWPYTYSYNPTTQYGMRPAPSNQTYIGISSGIPPSGGAAAVGTNHVYLIPTGGQATDEGALSGWLSAAGCQ